MLYRLTAAACAFALTFVFTGSAFAFDCIVAKKPAAAGSALSLEVAGSPTVTPLKNNAGTLGKPHGGFVQITVGGEVAGSTFAHAPGEDGVLPPARPGGSQFNCDGKGLDSAEVCFGP